MALVEVFRSKKKADTYLYLPKGADFKGLPATLQKVFGEPECVLGLDLEPERQLARYTGADILVALEVDGYFLQMPDNTTNTADRAQAC